METKHKIYYAHSKLTYGTARETLEVEFIKKKFPKANIICPHTTIGELKDFQDYLHIVDCCTNLIISEMDGYVGKGVFSEIARAFSNNTPVYVLREPNNRFCLIQVTGIEVINQNDWKRKYGKLIAKGRF